MKGWHVQVSKEETYFSFEKVYRRRKTRTIQFPWILERVHAHIDRILHDFAPQWIFVIHKPANITSGRLLVCRYWPAPPEALQFRSWIRDFVSSRDEFLNFHATKRNVWLAWSLEPLLSIPRNDKFYSLFDNCEHVVENCYKYELELYWKIEVSFELSAHFK